MTSLPNRFKIFSLAVLIAIVVASLMLTSKPDRVVPEPAGTLKVKVVDESTGQEIRGVKLALFDSASPFYYTPVRDNRTTDVDGSVTDQIHSTVAHVEVVDTPDGYWTPGGHKQFAVPASGALTVELTLKKGTTWDIDPLVNDTNIPLGSAVWSIVVVDGSAVPLAGRRKFDPQGATRLTLSSEARQCRIACFHPQLGQLESDALIWIDIAQDPGFDSTAVVSRQLAGSNIQLIDSHQRSVTIANAEVVLKDKRVILRPTVRVPPAQVIQLSGRVVDESGNAIPNAVVFAQTTRGPDRTIVSRVLIGTAHDSGAIQPTDSLLIPDGCDCQIIACALGYQERTIEEVAPQLHNGRSVVELGNVKLGKGASASVVVKDAAGYPVPWAEVVAHGGTLPTFARTNREGIATFSGLSERDYRVIALVGPGGNEAGALTVKNGGENHGSIRLKDKVTLADSSKSPSPSASATSRPQPPKEIQPVPLKIAVGNVAPQLSIHRWTDGKAYSLKDYLGKVVVLKFTGHWCSACRSATPRMIRLSDHFKDHDVVFIEIHTPTEDDSKIAAMMLKDHWPKLMAVDQPLDPSDKSSISGKTAADYGVQGYPSVVILDRTGRVADSDEILQRAMSADQANTYWARVAKQAGVAWPMSESLPQEKLIEARNALGFESLRERIDIVLRAQPE